MTNTRLLAGTLALRIIDAALEWDTMRERWNTTPPNDDTLLPDLTAADTKLRITIAHYRTALEQTDSTP